MNNNVYWRLLLGFILLPTFVERSQSAPAPAEQVEFESEEQNLGAKFSLLEKSKRGGRARVKVRIVDHTLEVLDQDGKKKKEMKLEDDDKKHIKTHIRRSKKGRKLGIHTTRGIKRESESWEESEYIVIDDDGNETLRLKNPGGETLVPAPNGKYAIGLLSRMAPSGPPLFIDVKGLRNKWLKGFGGGTWPDKYYAEDASFSSDAKKVAIGARMSRRMSLTILYDENGTETGRIESASKPTLSSSGGYVALQCSDGATANVFCVADSNGNVMWRDTDAFKGSIRAHFSADESRVLFAGGFGVLRLFDAVSGKLLWSWKSDMPILDNGFEALVVRGLDASDDLSTIALGAMIRKSAGPGNVDRHEDRVLIFKNGLVAGEISSSPGGIEANSAENGEEEMNLSVDDTGNSVTIAVEGRMRTYKVREKK